MKYLKKIIYFFLILFLTHHSISGQTVLPVSSMEVYLVVAPNDSSNIWGDTLFENNTALKATMAVLTQDTLNIDSVHVKMGTTNGSGNLINKVFSYNQTGTFTDGTAFYKNGYNLSIELGTYVGINIVYAEIKLQDSNGNFSTITQFNNN